jgi:hypothetical protein
MTRFFYRPVNTVAATSAYDPFNALVRDFFAPETTSDMRVKFKEAANEYTLVWAKTILILKSTVLM